MVAASANEGHPKGLYVLFFSELWERFSYYGMRSLLVLYMTKELLFGDRMAFGVYGAYTALVYATPVIGGMLSDRILGHRKAILLGGVLMAVGHFAMAIQNNVAFYSALALIAIGNGFFKPNISTMVGSLYKEGDPRRDSGFTIFYMGINIGAFLSPLVCGLIGETYGWHYGFGIAGLGMLLGLYIFSKNQSKLGSHGLPPNPSALKKVFVAGLSRQNAIYVAAFAAVPLFAYGLYQTTIVSSALGLVGLLVFGWLLYTAMNSPKVARDRLLLVMALMVFHCLFWAFFEQAGSSMTLFTDRNVDRTVFGWTMPTSMAQSFNPLFIFTLGPFFAWMWVRLARAKMMPSIPLKFALGMFGIGLGFFMLVIGGGMAGSSAQAMLIWLVLAYFMHTVGELFLSPIGLSAVTKLAPAKLVSTVMGAWFLSVAFGNHFAGAIAKLTGSPEHGAEAQVSVAESLATYSTVFTDIAWVAIGVGGFLLLISPFLKKLAHGVDD